MVNGTKSYMKTKKGLQCKHAHCNNYKLLITTLEDARFTHWDICILYRVFKNIFGSIGHARFLDIMEDLGYPQNVIALEGKIFSQHATTFIDEYFSKHTTNHNTKRNHTRRHTKRMCLCYLSWTTIQMSTHKKQWIILQNLTLQTKLCNLCIRFNHYL